MTKYICHSEEINIGSLPPEEVKKLMFDTEAEAIEWKKKRSQS